MELAIEICFYSFLNLITIDSYKNASDSILTLSGIIGCGVALILPSGMAYLIGLHYKNLMHKNYDTLMEDIKQDESSWSRYYYPLFLFYRTILTGTIVLLMKIPYLQCSIVTFISFVVRREY